jgi:hypothetical protein
MYEPDEKTDLRDILDQVLQNAQRRVTMADSPHLQVREREAHHVVGNDTVHVVTKYETHLEGEGSVNTYVNNADSTHQQDVTKAYDRMAAVSTADDTQHQLMPGQSIPRAFLMNKALPEAKEETKRGLQFLHISDNMPRQSGTIAVARRPPMPDAAPKEKEPNVQVTLCQEDRRDEACVHTYDEEFVTLARYDKKPAAATLANYIEAPGTYHESRCQNARRQHLQRGDHPQRGARRCRHPRHQQQGDCCRRPRYLR